MAVLSLGLGPLRRGDGGSLIDTVPHLARTALHDPSVRVRRVAILMLLLQVSERRVARILRGIVANEPDAKAVRLAGWALRQREKRA